MKVEFSKRFRKAYQKAPVKIQSAFDERLAFFMKSPFAVVLNNHSLKGKFLAYRSINVTGDWRAIFRQFEKYTIVIFETIGSHGNLYK